MKIFFFCLLVGFAHASESQWRVGKTKLEVENAPGEEFWISSSCVAKKDCDAWKATRNRATGLISGPGGTNPGSIACRTRFKGDVIIGMAEDGATQGFCVFPDKSMVSLNGIWR